MKASEWLASIALVAVTTGVVVHVTVWSCPAKAHWNSTKAGADALRSRVLQFQVDTGRLPTNLDELLNAGTNSTGWKGPYGKAQLLLDSWKRPYLYSVGSSGHAFVVASLGRDGTVGGEQQDADIVLVEPN